MKICRGASLISGEFLVFLEALISLENDAVYHRILADVDHEIASFGAGDIDVGEELGRVKVLQRLVERFRRIGLPLELRFA